MIVKKYEAPTMQKALAEVKKDLGSDAVILHTKTRKSNGLFGLWGKEMVEITASRDIKVKEKKISSREKVSPQPGALAQPRVVPPKPKEPKLETTGALLKYYKQAMVQEENAGTDEVKDENEMRLLQSDLNEVKSLVHSLLRRSKCADLGNATDELLDAYMLLIEQDLSEDLAKDVIAAAESRLSRGDALEKEKVAAAVKQVISEKIPEMRPIDADSTTKGKVIAFVGPTGVGKTTTIAKLAADFSLRKRKDVALITIDTYRIAAVEQLRTYADIINVPLEVVLTPEEVGRAIEKHSHRDLIFIDTAGRSHKNSEQMQELDGFLRAAKPAETHLVLSSSTNRKNVEDILTNFRSCRTDKLLFTKLDEAVSFGMILNVMKKMEAGISYLTTGQNVPDDICVRTPEEMAEMIYRGEI